jgi:hypothetical protein
MVDIETMGTNKDAPITQIGAVYFSMKTGKTGDEFIINLDLEDSIAHGAKPDGRTIEWWLHQSEGARDSILGVGDYDWINNVKEDTGLEMFNNFAARAKRVWSHATFDFVMIMEAMKRRGIRPQIHYRKARDIRTLTGLAGMTREQIDMFKVDRPGVHHNGLDDAVYQVAYCHECFKILKGDNE